MHSNIIGELERLYIERGARRYEIAGRNGVNQLQHALQCAARASHEGASTELVAAALLHDIGHLLHDDAADELGGLHDDVHQYIALSFLRPFFPPAVLEPIKLHVDAKRYLCSIDLAYHGLLSIGSQRSLAMQGGALDVVSAQTFIARPFAEDAVRMRRWDDLSKDVRASVPPFAAYRNLLAAVATRAETAPVRSPAEVQG
jgi:phosphonate degradation associated HDIG domain protein